MDTDFQGTADEAQAARDALDLAAYRLRELMEAGTLPLPPHAIMLSPLSASLVVLGIVALVAGAAYALYRRNAGRLYAQGRSGVTYDFDRFRSGYVAAGGDAAALRVLDEFGDDVLDILPPPDLGLIPERVTEGWGHSFTFTEDDDK